MVDCSGRYRSGREWSPVIALAEGGWDSSPHECVALSGVQVRVGSGKESVRGTVFNGNLPPDREDYLESGAVPVTGHLLDSHYWEAPTLGPEAEDYGRTEMSDERLSGEATFTVNGELWESSESWSGEAYLYWGSMVIENEGGTWEGSHFAADHHAQFEMHGPLVMQLVGSGDYEGLSAILYLTVASELPLEESLDGIIFPGDLPSDREWVGPPVFGLRDPLMRHHLRGRGSGVGSRQPPTRPQPDHPPRSAARARSSQG